MKKFLLLSMMCLMALSMQAQRCAVLEFKARVGISQDDVEGISAIFITYFHPAGYTMVERTQIDKAIDEQNIQRSTMTESQMVRIGQILNVSKIVIGDVNMVMGQYNVDVRVINVESGTVAATDGATFAPGSSYRTTMQTLAQRLAGKVAIKPGATVQPTPTKPAAPSTPKTRTNVEVLYGYLKIFPNELGVFHAEPSSVIAQINKQAMHGYNNWRIPTNEELALLRANGYLGNSEYMTSESEHGIVLLVSDGDDYETIQAEEQERQAKIRAEHEQERLALIKAEQEAKAEQERQVKIKAEQEAKAEQERVAALKAQGYVDLGLPSGTLWKDRNEDGGFFTYEQALNKFGDKLPTKEQLKELRSKCQWTRIHNGDGMVVYKVVGPNGNFISLPGEGYCDCNGRVAYDFVGSCGYYVSSSPEDLERVWTLHFCAPVYVRTDDRCKGYSVRLVQD